MVNASARYWGTTQAPTFCHCGGGSSSHCTQSSPGEVHGSASPRSHTGVQQLVVGQPSVASEQMSPGSQPWIVAHESPSLPSPSAAPGVTQTNPSNAA